MAEATSAHGSCNQSDLVSGSGDVGIVLVQGYSQGFVGQMKGDNAPVAGLSCSWTRRWRRIITVPKFIFGSRHIAFLQVIRPDEKVGRKGRAEFHAAGGKIQQQRLGRRNRCDILG